MVGWLLTPPPPTVRSMYSYSHTPPPLFEPLSEVNSTDLGSDWCGGGEGLTGVLEQGVKGQPLRGSHLVSQITGQSQVIAISGLGLLLSNFFVQRFLGRLPFSSHTYQFQLFNKEYIYIYLCYYFIVNTSQLFFMCVESVLSQLNSLLPYSLFVLVLKIYRALLNIY